MSDQFLELENLKSDAASEETSNSFMEPKKKGRGRPKGSTKAKAEADRAQNPMGGIGASQNPTQDLEKVKGYLRPVVELISMKGVQIAEDERAAMAKTEMEIITDAAANCVNQYLPNVLGEHANAIVLATALGAWAARVLVLRQMKLAELIEEKRKREAAGIVDAEPAQPAMN